MPTIERLSENSHQGFEGIKAALCLAELEAKPNVASGMPACLRPNGTGSRCSGKERDAESGLDYFGARYFSSPQGRFTTPDPMMASARASNPQTWNRYSYALNNPLRFVDPDGLEVPESCAKDPNCAIKIKVNVIYDKGANKGQGLTDAQK